MSHPKQAIELLQWMDEHVKPGMRVLERPSVPDHLKLFVDYCRLQGWLGNVFADLTDTGRLQLLGLLPEPDVTREVVREAPPAKKTRIGRPKRDETPKDVLILAALVAHHQYESDGSVMNPTPIVARQFVLANNKVFSTKSLSEFLTKHFGSQAEYAQACHRGGIGRRLQKLMGDDPAYHEALRDDDLVSYGDDDD